MAQKIASGQINLASGLRVTMDSLGGQTPDAQGRIASGDLKLAVKNIKKVATDKALSGMRDTALNVLREELLETMNLCKEILDRINKISPGSKRAHLSVVNE